MNHAAEAHSPAIHRDDLASKTGMWLFLFTEMLLFGTLFIVYSVYRYRNITAFHLAAEELDVTIGTINTIILLISSATVAMSITAHAAEEKKACHHSPFDNRGAWTGFPCEQVFRMGPPYS
jgi:heme/copper-type cytochrome/quinol oxidase subunit 3